MCVFPVPPFVLILIPHVPVFRGGVWGVGSLGNGISVLESDPRKTPCHSHPLSSQEEVAICELGTGPTSDNKFANITNGKLAPVQSLDLLISFGLFM